MGNTLMMPLKSIEKNGAKIIFRKIGRPIFQIRQLEKIRKTLKIPQKLQLQANKNFG